MIRWGDVRVEVGMLLVSTKRVEMKLEEAPESIRVVIGTLAEVRRGRMKRDLCKGEWVKLIELILQEEVER